MNVRDRFGAYVVYQIPAGHRLSVMVVPSDNEPLSGRPLLLQGRRAFIDSQRGVSTVVFRDPDGLDYVFTADLDENALANWIETVYLGR